MTGAADVVALALLEDGALVTLDGGVVLVGELVIDTRVVPDWSNSVANMELR